MPERRGSPVPREARTKNGRARTYAACVLAAVCVLAGLGFIVLRGRPRIPEPVSRVEARAEVRGNAAAMAATSLPPSPPRAANDDGKTEDGKTLWEKRLVRAKKTLDTYLEATRYPPTSRPIREHPDLRAPHHVEPVSLPLARKDRVLTDARVSLRQDRFYLVGDESVAMEIVCSNSDGTVPCEVTSARTTVPPSEAKGAVPPEVDVPFASGLEGVATATFQPSKQGDNGYHGTVRVAVELRIRTESGSASFDIQYTPESPAAFNGKAREALSGGSLDFFVEMDVAKQGRYVLSGRVDDKSGQTFAYVTFNDELSVGHHEVPLRVFGKLVRDEAAQSPFRLHDVEGYLLKENTFPDREPMAALEGTVLTSRTYNLRDFSDATWDSDDKKRHVTEFQKDVDDAQRNAQNP